jgi:membrane protease YdiL (CAAX protease family)
MVAAEEKAPPRPRLNSHLRGHLLLFDPKTRPAYAPATGVRLLLLAVAIEAVRIAAVRWLGPWVPLWLLVPVLLGLTLWSVRGVARLRLSDMGFVPWRQWTISEKSYFLQLLLIANIVFPLVLATGLRNCFATSSPLWVLWSVFVPYLFFGFYQEVVYRGMLQRELVRRWGPLPGILAANLLYTFGPLHSSYFASPPSVSVPMFASVFLIGLFFGMLFMRSGNLWIVAVIHAVGNSYIVGSLGAQR